ncbi:Ankyrin repeat and protein kinase domain-containing protein 1 [Cladobotryum mycophilum]|uniref:Ankyrin repeat and protein kinase domain-containing protein 1 n=1 Tax=Cladobotryum mycophilum TaxID=491253 RepID=A0ABR0SWJ0_9HYPO
MTPPSDYERLPDLLCENDAKERRRRQNRIAQRNHRRRKAEKRLSGATTTGDSPQQPDKSCRRCGSDSAKEPDSPLVQPKTEIIIPTTLPPMQYLPTPSDQVHFGHSVSHDPCSTEIPSFSSFLHTSPSLFEVEMEHHGSISHDAFYDHEQTTMSSKILPTEAQCPDISMSPRSASSPDSQNRSNTPIGCVPPPPLPKYLAGQLPLHLASQGGFTSVMSVLAGSGALLNARDARGRTPLHYAAEGGHVEALTVLLACGSDPRIVDSNGLSSLHIAASRGHDHIVGILIERGADPNLEVVSMTEQVYVAG